MLIQVYCKNEPLAGCDFLVAKEDAVIGVHVKDIAGLSGNPVQVGLVKNSENMAMKAAVLVSSFIKSTSLPPDLIKEPVQVACPDKAILDGICSMEYEGPDGMPVKCVPAGTKTAQTPRVRNKAKPKPEPKPDEKTAGPAGPDKTDAEPAAQPGDSSDSLKSLMADKGLVTGNNEVNLESQPGPETKAPDKPELNAPKAIAILKDCGVPSSQVPGVLEALKEAMDAQITLPMQVKLKLAKDGATGDMDPEETAKLVAPKFKELKALLNEIEENTDK